MNTVLDKFIEELVFDLYVFVYAVLTFVYVFLGYFFLSKKTRLGGTP